MPPVTEGEEGEFDQLRVDLQRAIRYACPASLADRADDLVQVAVMRVMEIRRKSERGRELSTRYLYKVAHSVVVDELRRIRSCREVSLEEANPSEPAWTETPERNAEAREIGQGILDCLRLLRRARRLAVTLHLQGHTVPEAASILGWGEKRTENLIYRGLAELRRCLKAKGLEP